MKIRLFLVVLFFLVTSLITRSEAVETRKQLKDKPRFMVNEESEIPTVIYYAAPRESLKGLKGIGILIEPLNPDIEPSGITRSRIKQDVELKLRQAGIPVFSEEERDKEPGKPYLYVNLNAYSWREEVIYGFSLKVDLNQLVLLDRDRKTGCFGTTWSTGSAGIIGANKVEHAFKTELAVALDKFIKDFLEANPR